MITVGQKREAWLPRMCEFVGGRRQTRDGKKAVLEEYCRLKDIASLR